MIHVKLANKVSSGWVVGVMLIYCKRLTTKLWHAPKTGASGPSVSSGWVVVKGAVAVAAVAVVAAVVPATCMFDSWCQCHISAVDPTFLRDDIIGEVLVSILGIPRSTMSAEHPQAGIPRNAREVTPAWWLAVGTRRVSPRCNLQAKVFD